METIEYKVIIDQTVRGLYTAAIWCIENGIKYRYDNHTYEHSHVMDCQLPRTYKPDPSHDVPCIITIYFVNVEDAMAYKLRWC